MKSEVARVRPWVQTTAPASVNVFVKAGPMYWDTPVISVTLPSSRIVRLPCYRTNSTK
jgi:hypothetical protein